MVILPLTWTALVEHSDLPKISFRRLGQLATSGSFGYVISRIPLETLVSKVRLHEMLIGQFGILASRFNTTFPEFQLEHEQLDLECQTLVYRMTVLLSLMEAKDFFALFTRNSAEFIISFG